MGYRVWLVNKSSDNIIYLDTSVITVWIITEDEPSKRSKLPLRARKCMELLDYITEGKLDCKLQTSDWALAEMIQSLRDRAIFKKFYLDGYEFPAFYRIKSQYNIEKSERIDINIAVNDFKKFLDSIENEKLIIKQVTEIIGQSE